MNKSIVILSVFFTIMMNWIYAQNKIEFNLKVKKGKYGNLIILKLKNTSKHTIQVTPAFGIAFEYPENKSKQVKIENKINLIYDWTVSQYKNNIYEDSLAKIGKAFNFHQGHPTDTATSFLLHSEEEIKYLLRNNSNEIKRVAIRVFDPKSNTGSKIIFKLYPTQRIRFFERVTHIEVDNVQSIMSFLE